jgi:CoA:oxalate CoA-transferase
MSGTRVAAGKHAAALGEHTLALLRESGLSEDRIAAMIEKSPLAKRG